MAQGGQTGGFGNMSGQQSMGQPSMGQPSMGQQSMGFSNTPIQNYRSSSQAPQFYKPAYQPQYQNYNMGNPYGASQYGQSPFMGGYGGYGQSPFMGTAQPTQSDLYAQRMMMQSGGQGYGMGGMQRRATPQDMYMQQQIQQQMQNAMGQAPSQEDTAKYQAMMGNFSGQGGMNKQMPDFMQGAFSNMLQQQQAGRGGATPTGGQSAMTSALSGLAGGIPMNAMMAKGGIASLIKK